MNGTGNRMVQETMNGTGNLDGSGDHEWYRKIWMVQETMNGTGKPGWFRRP
jgi:hypothetical protein